MFRNNQTKQIVLPEYLGTIWNISKINLNVSEQLQLFQINLKCFKHSETTKQNWMSQNKFYYFQTNLKSFKHWEHSKVVWNNLNYFQTNFNCFKHSEHSKCFKNIWKSFQNKSECFRTIWNVSKQIWNVSELYLWETFYCKQNYLKFVPKQIWMFRRHSNCFERDSKWIRILFIGNFLFGINLNKWQIY